MHLAIIGTGISGLACARKLHVCGYKVTLFEKSDVVGGRITTRQTEIGGFDSGAQFFTVVSPDFKQEVAAWHQAGLVLPWHARMVRLQYGVATVARPSSQRFVAVPGMNALPRHLAQGLAVCLGQTVRAIEPFGESGKWLLALTSDGATSRAGPFDAVVVATPADQAATLLAHAPALSGKADMTGHVACWALMLGFQAPLNLDYDGAWVTHHRLAWIARDDSKPQRREGERWIALARVEWSAEHVRDGSERARDKLIKAFQETTNTSVQPAMAAAQLWRYAQATKPLAKSCLWDEKLKIGACGDWFTAGLDGGGQIEHAYMSGKMLADKIAGTVGAPVSDA